VWLKQNPRRQFIAILLTAGLWGCGAGERQDVTVEGADRSFHLYAPKTENTARKLPVIFNFHGGTPNLVSVFGPLGAAHLHRNILSRMQNFAEKTKEFIVVHPNGLGGSFNGRGTITFDGTSVN